MSCQRVQFGWLVIAVLPALVLLATAVLPTTVPAAGTLKDDPEPSAAGDLAAAAEALAQSLEFEVAPAVTLRQNAENVHQKSQLLALIANAVTSEQGDFKWKSNAPAVRDAAVDLAKAAKEQDSNRAANALKSIQELIAESGAANSGSAAMQPLEIISLHDVMLEIESRCDQLDEPLKGPAKFKQSQKEIAQHAGVLALLATTARSDLHSARKAGKPQNLFEQFADALFAASVDLQSAAWDGKHKAAAAARKRMDEACAHCHEDYRPEE